MTTDANLADERTAVIARYYDACTTGDLDDLRATLHPEVVHYFLAPNPGSTPVAGAEHLARYWRKVTRMIGARWVIDHVLAAGDEAVIEWTMFWLPEGSEERVATRGAEWFVFRDGLIAEIRSYYQQHNRATELDAFPYQRRRYSVPGSERSAIHPRPPARGDGTA
ncbi:MAG: nuclear transport factor 2 family protein [Pseudonocardiaceae bacterium]|nr:nuclear transport factor 2 family protein [Pseudonocardiaceae bacterium]